MKKIIASVLLVCFGVSMLIAEVPFAVTSSSDSFAGFEGIELTVVEEGEVEGGIAHLAAFAVGVAVRATGSAIVAGATEYALTGKVTAKTVIIGAISGAVTGGVGGLFAKSTTTVVQMASSAVKGAVASGAGSAAATTAKKWW